MCNPELLADRYLTTLVDHLGLTAQPLDPTDPTSGIWIHHHGLNMHLENHAPADPEYLRITCLLNLDHAPEHVAAAAQRTTTRCKFVKVSPLEAGAALAVEMLAGLPDTMPSTLHLAAVIPRALHCLNRATDDLLFDVAFRALTVELGPDLDIEVDPELDTDLNPTTETPPHPHG